LEHAGSRILKYDAVLLDADETLFDFREAEQFALGETLSESGITLSVEQVIDDFRRINSVVWAEFEAGGTTSEVIRTKRFVLLLDQFGVAADAQVLSDRYVAHLSRAPFLLEGARELLEQLHGKAPLVLVTNGLSSVQWPRLADSGIETFFRAIVISEEQGVQKPEPEIFRVALKRAGGVSPERAIMCGDNLNSDVRGALEVGMDACWVNLRGKANETDVVPTAEVRSLADLPAVLGL
jgi:2-haloacid dehalogenase